MVGRVLLDRGLRVSNPGIEVTTAGPLGLAFNSDFSQLSPFLTAEIDINWSHAYDWREFGFGKTFPTAPIIHMQRVISAGQYQELSPIGNFFWFGNHEIRAETTPAALRIFSFITTPPSSFRLRYTIMDYNL